MRLHSRFIKTNVLASATVITAFFCALFTPNHNFSASNNTQSSYLAPYLSASRISKASLTAGKFAANTENYLDKLDYYEDLLANFPLAFHAKCWDKNAALIEKTFKSLTVKVEVYSETFAQERSFVVGTVNWLSTGPLGLKKINDSLGWVMVDNTRDWIWEHILDQIETRFNSPNSPIFSVKVASAMLNKIADNVINDFYTRLQADDNFLELSPQARELFLTNREIFKTTLQSSISFPMPIPENNEQAKMKNLLDLQNFATAISRTSQPQQHFLSEEKDPLTALYNIVTDPKARPEDLESDDIEKTRKDDLYIQRKYKDKAYAYQAGLDIIKIFGRPQNQSIQLLTAHNRAMEAIKKHEYLTEIKNSINELKSNNKNSKDRRKRQLRFFTQFLKQDPRQVSIDFLQSQSIVYPELKEQLEPLLFYFSSNKKNATPVLSKQYYDDLFYQAYRTPEKIKTQLAVNLNNNMAAAKVFGDEYFLLSVNDDNSITEIFTDLKGLGFKNLQDIHKLVTAVRNIDKQLSKAKNAQDLLKILTDLFNEYTQTPFSSELQKQLTLYTSRVINKKQQAWQPFLHNLKKDLTLKLLEKAEYGVTLQLRLGEYKLLHSQLQNSLTNPTLRQQAFIEEAIDLGRRVVVTTVPKPEKMRADDFRAKLSEIQEAGASLSKEFEALGISHFYLKYSGSLQEGTWTFISKNHQLIIPNADSFYVKELALNRANNEIQKSA